MLKSFPEFSVLFSMLAHLQNFFRSPNFTVAKYQFRSKKFQGFFFSRCLIFKVRFALLFRALEHLITFRCSCQHLFPSFYQTLPHVRAFRGPLLKEGVLVALNCCSLTTGLNFSIQKPICQHYFSKKFTTFFRLQYIVFYPYKPPQFSCR